MNKKKLYLNREKKLPIFIFHWKHRRRCFSIKVQHLKMFPKKCTFSCTCTGRPNHATAFCNILLFIIFLLSHSDALRLNPTKFLPDLLNKAKKTPYVWNTPYPYFALIHDPTKKEKMFSDFSVPFDKTIFFLLFFFALSTMCIRKKKVFKFFSGRCKTFSEKSTGIFL